MKKRLLASLLAAMMMASMMVTTAFAAEPETTGEPEIHCITLDAADLLALDRETYKTVTPSLGLSSGSGWSIPVTANFSTIPAGATVTKVKVSPGKVSYSGPITSVICVSAFRLTSPDGDSTDLSFSTVGMETTAFNGYTARGTWKLSIFGTHAGSGYGVIKYTNTKITIWYTT